jgi:hypothetical protein
VGLVKNEGKNGAVGRGYRLGKLGLSLVGSYLGYQAQNLVLSETERPKRAARFQQRASGRVREELGDMKGAAMKLGQLLSMQGHALPETALRELAELQMRAPAMHASLARAQFKASLGRYPEELFREFDPDPIAAASLGQVHRAVNAAGEKVAVKIQYPAIRAAIENDFRVLKTAALPARLLGRAPAALVDEIQRGILEETDYRREAENLEFFRRRLSGLTYLEIPRVYPALSTDRVLTMSYLEGETLSLFLKRKPSAALRDRIGERLLEIYYTQLYRLKAVHADQHPGNYLFQADGRIGQVDFGCVKHIDYSELIECHRQRTWREGEAQARHVLGLIFGPNAPYARTRHWLPLLEQRAAVLFPQNGTKDTTVDYRDLKVWEFLRQNSKLALKNRLIVPDYAFIARAELGLYHLLHQLGARVNITEIWDRVSKAPVAV